MTLKCIEAENMERIHSSSPTTSCYEHDSEVKVSAAKENISLERALCLFFILSYCAAVILHLHATNISLDQSELLLLS